MLRSAGAFAALAPMNALAITPANAAIREIERFPSREFVLRRELERGLGDGKAIIVVREWQCRFEQVGAGANVLGKQVFVDVVAPPPLAALAELEKQREVDRFLPAQLDRYGRIVATGEGSGDEIHVSSAIQAATDLFERMPSLVSVSEARDFLSAVGQSAANLVSRIPPDLFFPVEGRTSETRSLPLPNGKTGEIEVAFAAATDPLTGLLESIERTVVTRAEGGQRMSREGWSLTPNE